MMIYFEYFLGEMAGDRINIKIFDVFLDYLTYVLKMWVISNRKRDSQKGIT